MSAGVHLVMSSRILRGWAQLSEDTHTACVMLELWSSATQKGKERKGEGKGEGEAAKADPYMTERDTHNDQGGSLFLTFKKAD